MSRAEEDQSAAHGEVGNLDLVPRPAESAAFATVKGNPAAQAFWDDAIGQLGDPVPRQLVLEFQAGAVVSPMSEVFLAMVVGESLKVPARIRCAVMQAPLTDDFSQDLRKITAPTLILVVTSCGRRLWVADLNGIVNQILDSPGVRRECVAQRGRGRPHE